MIYEEKKIFEYSIGIFDRINTKDKGRKEGKGGGRKKRERKKGKKKGREGKRKEKKGRKG